MFLNILKSLEGSDLKVSVHKLESVFNTLLTSKKPYDQRLRKYFRITKVRVKIENHKILTRIKSRLFAQISVLILVFFYIKTGAQKLGVSLAHSETIPLRIC